MKLDYNDHGHAKVLRAASEQLERAARCLDSIKTAVTPPIVAKALRKEADLCIEQAAELMQAVKEDRK